MCPDSMPTNAANDSLKDSPWDERRGVHLIAPGDIVRYQGDLWDVTGVFLSTDHQRSTVTLVMAADRFNTELRVPLPLIEGACEVYLRAERKPI